MEPDLSLGPLEIDCFIQVDDLTLECGLGRRVLNLIIHTLILYNIFTNLSFISLEVCSYLFLILCLSSWLYLEHGQAFVRSEDARANFGLG